MSEEHLKHLSIKSLQNRVDRIREFRDGPYHEFVMRTLRDKETPLEISWLRDSVSHELGYRISKIINRLDNKPLETMSVSERHRFVLDFIFPAEILIKAIQLKI